MMGGKVHLTGYIDVPAPLLARATSALQDHIRLTRAEAGCEKFVVTPCSRVEARFLVDETFVDQAAFDHHQVRARASHWGILSRDFARHFDISELKP